RWRCPSRHSPLVPSAGRGPARSATTAPGGPPVRVRLVEGVPVDTVGCVAELVPGAPCRRGVRHVLGAGSGPEVSGVHAGAVVASVPEVQPNDTHAEHLASNDVRSPDAPLVSVGPIRDDLAIAQADREASTAPQPAARIRLGVDLLPEPGR